MTTENTHKVPNVPPLRFPEFSGEWERKRIRELFAINVGGDIDKRLSILFVQSISNIR